MCRSSHGRILPPSGYPIKMPDIIIANALMFHMQSKMKNTVAHSIIITKNFLVLLFLKSIMIAPLNLQVPSYKHSDHVCVYSHAHRKLLRNSNKQQ